MTLTNHLYQQELYERFLQKLIDDWERYFYRHGDVFVNLSAIRNKNGFVEDVADAIDTVLAAQLGPQEAHRLTPSKDTFRRLLFEYNPETRWQSKTREALCLYIGFASWAAFKESIREELKKEPVTVTINQITVRPAWLPARQVVRLLPYAAQVVGSPQKTVPWRMIAVVLTLLTLVLVVGRWGWHRWQIRPFNAAQLAGVQFYIVRTEGLALPQTLTLAYDVSSLGTDSVVVDFGTIGNEFNQHPGDLDRKVLHQTKGRFTHPFWKPAFCAIQLIARNQVVATIRHTTRTDGWTGWTADPGGNTQALSQGQIQSDGRLKVPLVARKDQPGDFFSHLVYQHPFDLDADEMDWQVRLRNPFAEGGISCFDPEISIRWGGGDRQCIAMQTTRIGCGVGALIQLGEKQLANGEYDLSRLSADFEGWRTLRILTKNKMAWFYIDGQLAFKHPYAEDFNPVQILDVSFKGSGSVDWVRLANSRTGQVIYQDDF